MTPTSLTPPPPPDPAVTVHHPDAHHIHLTIRHGADIADLAAALATLPNSAYYLDHDGDPTHLTVIFHRVPEPPPSVLALPPGWTPPTANGHRPTTSPTDQAVQAVTAGLVLGAYDRDIQHPPVDRTRPTVLTIVRLVRARANALGRPQPHR